jgi:ElaB/YqjD/DUF883 family membrane-anchored ribosome-binding protein
MAGEQFHRSTCKETAMSATLATAIAVNDAGRAKEAVDTPFQELFDGVDDLIRRVADVENPEIRKIRARVHATMVAAKGVTVNGVAVNGVAQNRGTAKGALDGGLRANHERPRAAQVADDGADYLYADDYLRESGHALGVALLVGLSLGLIASSQQ